MTLLGRSGGWLLLILGAALAAYGLVDERDVVVLTGALVATCGVVLDRLAGVTKRQTAVSAAKAQMRREIEERVAEQLRRSRNN